MRSLDAGSHATSEDPGKYAKTFVGTIARAIFWPAQHASTIGVRVLEGEVQLKKTVHPSVIFPRFAVRVSKTLFSLLLENIIH